MTMSKDTMEPAYFDLDGICQLKVYGDRGLVSAVSKELAFYRVDPQKAPNALDLEIELNRLKAFKPSSNPRELPPYDFFSRHKLARWALRFERLSQPPYRVRFYGNAFSELIVSKQIVEPMIRVLAQTLGFVFVHSAGLVKEGRAVVVAGGGGSGKTRLLLQWIKQGHPFLSDDFTILSSGRARRYVTPLRIGARLLNESGMGKNLAAIDRLSVYGRAALRRLLFNYAKLQSKLDIQTLFPEVKIADQVELKALLLIGRAGIEAGAIESLDCEAATDRLLAINRQEMYGFTGYLSGLHERTGGKMFSDFFTVLRARLREHLKNIPCFETSPIRNLNLQDLNSLIQKIDKTLLT